MALISWRKYRLAWVFIAILCVRGYAQVTSVLESAHGPNAPAQENRSYVVLVSLDGIRYDYATALCAKNLQALGKEGGNRSGWHDSGLSVAHLSQSLFDRDWPLS